MMHVNIRMMLGILIAGAFLLGSLVTPVAALQSVIIEQKMNTAYAPGANNHTYVYSSVGDAFFRPSLSRLHVNEDIDLTQYRYSTSGWSTPSTTPYSEPTNPPFDWQNFNSFDNGPYGNDGILPVFFDFQGSDGSGAVINTTMERRVFTMSFGQHTAVVMDTQYLYFGALSISGQEFVYITVSSMQDDISWQAGVYDPQGRAMYIGAGNDGDIIVLPFRPSVAGTYYLMLIADPGSGKFAQFDFYPEAVAPQLISSGQVVTGNLPSSEFIVSPDTGSLIYDETPPTVITYKIDPGTAVSTLYYSFNYPEDFISGVGITHPTRIMFSSDAFIYSTIGGARFAYSLATPINNVYSYRGGILYITVMGGDNVDYTLAHESNVAESLPLNHEFILENYYGNPVNMFYSLDLDNASMIKVNSTAAGPDYTISIYGINEEGYYVQRSFTDTATIDSATWGYLPAGKYIAAITVAATTISEMIEFTLGSVTDSSNADIVYLGGFEVPTDPNHQYNLTLTLNNVYNVSSVVGIYVYDQFFTSRYSGSLTMGTWWDGSTAIPHPTAVTETSIVLSSRLWSDDHATIILVTYPYNNTLGVGNAYPGYALDFTVDWADITYYNFNQTASLDVASEAKAYNFTLEYPASITAEYYALKLNTTPGTWYNVSIKTLDANTIPWIEIHSIFDHRTHILPWPVGPGSGLRDTLQGSLPNISVQFGAISNEVALELRVNRALAEEGFLWIEVTPLPTHALEVLPTPPIGADLLAILGSIAIPVGIGAVVIVVVAIVYVKKIKK